MSTEKKNIWTTTSPSVETTLAIGEIIGSMVRAGDVIALNGELGAGKTQMVRGIASGMGCEHAMVASPTYVLVHEYAASAGKPVLVHIDAYRLKSLEDLESIGWEFSAGDQLSDLRKDAVVAVEWADRLGDLIGDDLFTIQLEHADEGRTITLAAQGSWLQRAESLCRKLDDVILKYTKKAEKTVQNATMKKCPTCKKMLEQPTEFSPFCSKQCKLADLNRWFKGDYTISRPIEQSDLEQQD